MRINNSKVSVLLICAVLFTSMTGCAGKDKVPELKEPVSAQKEYVEVARGDISDRTYYDGYVTPAIVTAAFSTSGRVGEVDKFIGNHVKEGEQLATLDIESVEQEMKERQLELNYLTEINQFTNVLSVKEIQMNQVMASIDSNDVTGADTVIGQAKAELDALKAKVGNGETVSENEIAQYEEIIQQYEDKRNMLFEEINDLNHANGQSSADAKAATGIYGIDTKECNAKLAELQKKKDNATLVAPCSGTVIAAMAPDGTDIVRSGIEVEANTPVYYIANETEKHLVSQELTQNKMKNGMSAVAIVDGKEYPLTEADYPVDYVALSKKMSKEVLGQNVDLPCRFTLENEELMQALSCGEYVTICLVESEQKDTLYVSNDAVYRNGNEDYVIRIEDGKEVKVDVKLGLKATYETEIKEGVNEGDVLVAKTVFFETQDLKEVSLSANTFDWIETQKPAGAVYFHYQNVFCESNQARLKEICVEEKQAVKAGDPLVKFTLYSNQSELTELEYKLVTLQDDHDKAVKQIDKQRTIALGERNEREAANPNDPRIGVCDSQIDYLTTTIAQMDAETNYAKTVVNNQIAALKRENSRAVITADADGVVNSIDQTLEGKSLTLGKSICEVRDMNYLLISTKDEGKLRYNMPVEVKGTIDDEEVTLQGRVVASSDVVPVWTQNTFAVFSERAIIELTSDQGLDVSQLKNATATAVTKSFPNAYTVDKKMLFTDTYGYYIYKVEGDSRIKQYVTLTGFLDDKACVLDGIAEDETVLRKER